MTYHRPNLIIRMGKISEFRSKLPTVKAWIQALLDENTRRSRIAADLNFPRIKKALPGELLEKTKVIYVDGKIPVPPLGEMGLAEFIQLEQMALAGITYDDTIFIHQNSTSEGLHFHELVHVVQWRKLSFDNFLLAYGLGVIEYGYEDSPFEKMAYKLERLFESGDLSGDVLQYINRKTDDIWQRTENIMNAISNNETLQ